MIDSYGCNDFGDIDLAFSLIVLDREQAGYSKSLGRLEI